MCACISILIYIFVSFAFSSWNDLIVGAPFYFDRKKDQGGAVYIYMNENGSFQKTATTVLKGPATSAFGFAVAAIGDINQDGFQGMTLNTIFVLQLHKQNKVNASWENKLKAPKGQYHFTQTAGSLMQPLQVKLYSFHVTGILSTPCIY